VVSLYEIFSSPPLVCSKKFVLLGGNAVMNKLFSSHKNMSALDEIDNRESPDLSRYVIKRGTSFLVVAKVASSKKIYNLWLVTMSAKLFKEKPRSVEQGRGWAGGIRTHALANGNSALQPSWLLTSRPRAC